MRITRAWRVAPAWVRELIDEMDGVRKVGCYWVNRVSGMCIRSPFVFDFNDRTLRFKGFDDPVHIDDIQNVKKDDHDCWDRVRFLESVDAVNFSGYYDAIDDGFAAVAAMTT